MIEETKQFKEQLVDWIDDKKGENTLAIDISELTVLADYFIITSASNERQVEAIVEKIKEEAAKNNKEILRVEGEDNNRWVLLDFGDIIVHVFHEKERDFYKLERLWSHTSPIT